jgi:hypothetical protein
MGTVHEDQYIFLIISLSDLLRMRNVSDKICRENQNTHFPFNDLICSKIVPFMRYVEKYCRLRQATDDNMEHADYMLDTEAYKHTLRICNHYCCLTTTMVTPKRLSCTRYSQYIASHISIAVSPWSNPLT